MNPIEAQLIAACRLALRHSEAEDIVADVTATPPKWSRLTLILRSALAAVDLNEKIDAIAREREAHDDCDRKPCEECVERMVDGAEAYES